MQVHDDINHINEMSAKIQPKLTSNAVHVAAASTSAVAIITATVDGRHENGKGCDAKRIQLFVNAQNRFSFRTGIRRRTGVAIDWIN
jgi:hypothetical protein